MEEIEVKREPWKIKYDFLSKHRKGKHSGGEHNYNRILSELADSTQRWVKEHQEDDDEFKYKLSELNVFLSCVQDATNIELALLNYKDEEELNEEQKKRKEQLSSIIWENTDPKWIFQSGIGGKSYKQISKDELMAQIAEYFSKKWLQNNRLEYIFLTALIFQEVVQFGESVKEKMAGGKTNRLGQNVIYEKAKGNLSEMNKLKLWQDFKRSIFISLPLSIFKFILFVVMPLVLLEGQYKGYYIVGLMIYLGISLFSRSRVSPSTDDKNSIEHWAKLYQEMYNVWLILKGPIINPTILKEKLNESSSMGAMWDNAIYSLVDKMIVRDASVFLTEGTADGAE